MAIIKNGILGPFQGPISRITGYIRLGVYIMRAKPDPQVKHNRSNDQKTCNSRFAFAMTFLNPATPFINVSFSLNRPKGTTAHNMAMSEILKNGIIGEKPDFKFNFPNMLVANGNLAMALNPNVEMTEPRSIRFSWDMPAKQAHQRNRDQVMLFAFMPDENLAFYMLSGARRNAQQEILEVCSGKPGQIFETYIAFISDDRKKISKSTYTGQIIIA